MNVFVHVIVDNSFFIAIDDLKDINFGCVRDAYHNYSLVVLNESFSINVEVKYRAS